MLMKIWAVIPAQPLQEGKSRLASVLSMAERRRLNESLFRQTLEITARTLEAHLYIRIVQQMGSGQWAEVISERPAPEVAASSRGRLHQGFLVAVVVWCPD
jgi:2-phospho-L-lactate guanylyltransferase (CobY/MobA/RfbA family)